MDSSEDKSFLEGITVYTWGHHHHRFALVLSANNQILLILSILVDNVHAPPVKLIHPIHIDVPIATECQSVKARLATADTPPVVACKKFVKKFKHFFDSCHIPDKRGKGNHYSYCISGSVP